MSGEPTHGKKATLGWPFSLALNHLLEREPWARERLAPFAGRTVELRNPPFPALRLCRAARTFRARCASSERLRMVTAAMMALSLE